MVTLMKRVFVIALMLAAGLAAQDKPKEPTVDELKAQLAQKDVIIAQLEAQLHEAQTAVSLYEAAMGIAKRRHDDQVAIDSAQTAAQAASTAVQAKTTKP